MNSPISILPEDLLMEIFDLCCPPDTDALVMRTYSWDELESDFGSLIRLTHVCHDWRLLAISMAKLWARIDIKWTYRGEKLFPFVRLFLERSASCPLHILITPCVMRGQTPPRIEELLSLLIPHHIRWKSICFVSSLPLLLDPHFFQSVERFSILEMAYVSLVDRADGLHRAIRASPLLRRYLWVPDRQADGLITPLPSFLTSLHYIPSSGTSAAQVAQNLSRLSSLVELQVKFSSSEDSSRSLPLQSTVSLPSLRKFELQINSTDYEAGWLCDALTLPNLRDLKLKLISSAVYSKITQLLKRSRCRVESLTLINQEPECDVDELRKFINSPPLQSLHHLHIDEILDFGIIKALLLPNLCRLQTKHHIACLEDEHLLRSCVTELALCRAELNSGMSRGRNWRREASSLNAGSGLLEYLGVRLKLEEEEISILFSADIFNLIVWFPVSSPA